MKLSRFFSGLVPALAIAALREIERREH